MGWYVHLHVAFPCDKNDGVAALAREMLNREYEAVEAKWFLDALSGRTGENPGPKGGLSLWGIVGNYSNGELFCSSLMPFWDRLLSEVPGGPLDFESVVVLEEQEQSEAATAYQIGWDEPNSADRRIVIKKCERLPFSWHQY
jgi:hypothetical protein